VTQPLRLVVSGATGRMGAAIGRLAAESDAWEVAGGIDRDGGSGSDPYPRLTPLDGAADLIRNADVLLDFSAPDFLRSLLETHGAQLAGCAIAVGTTGLGSEEHALLKAQAKRSPVLTAANFSVGVNLLAALVEQAARALGEGYDAEIVETHHRRKEDAPSGTALALGEALADGLGADLGDVRRDGRSGRPGARPDGEIGFHSLRGGDIVGDHRVLFIGERETIELSHRAHDRALFADGALRAGRWLAGRNAGLYSMRDVLGLG
jgi:4-hydroxy-tetrahydrodipicolinate reductase